MTISLVKTESSGNILPIGLPFQVNIHGDTRRGLVLSRHLEYGPIISRPDGARLMVHVRAEGLLDVDVGVRGVAVGGRVMDRVTIHVTAQPHTVGCKE